MKTVYQFSTQMRYTRRHGKPAPAMTHHAYSSGELAEKAHAKALDDMKTTWYFVGPIWPYQVVDDFPVRA